MTQLRILNLSKTYSNGVKAVDKLSLEIGTGMFGLLGPNGAGKSTLMRTIATLQDPDEGHIYFNEIDALADKMSLRKILGYLPQAFGVYPKVSAAKLLDYFACLKGIAKRTERARIIDEVLQATNLYDVRHKNVDSYSGGMKQRFGIAQLLLNQPQLIIVDEPTAGLDPAERGRFLNILREISTRSTVIFSTHIVDDVKELCHEVAIVNGGRLLQKVNPDDATRALQGQIWIKRLNRQDLSAAAAKYQVLSSNYNRDNSINIRVYAPHQPSDDFILGTATLEDVYFISLQHREQYS